MIVFDVITKIRIWMIFFFYIVSVIEIYKHG